VVAQKLVLGHTESASTIHSAEETSTFETRWVLEKRAPVLRSRTLNVTSWALTVTDADI
jgi:hypothetical protein